MRGWTALLLVALIVPLSGCFSFCEPPAPVSARGVPDSAPDTSGSGPSAFAIEVREEGPSGKPVAGAGVVFFWGDETSRDPSQLVQIGPDGIVVDNAGTKVQVGTIHFGITPPRYTTTLELRTDANGHAVGKLPANRIAGVVVAAPGYTEEVVRAFATGAGGSRSVVVPLFHDTLTLSTSGTISPGAFSTATVPVAGSAIWYPDTSLFSADYLDRLVSLELWLNWTNGPTAIADIGIGLGRASNAIDRYEDSATTVAPGDYTERLKMGLDELASLDFTGADQVLAGPATTTGYLAPLGLPYTLAWVGTFETRSAFESQCGFDVDNERGMRATPMPVAAWLGLGLLALAAVTRRDG